MTDVHVEIFDAGPYKVEGAIEIVDGKGNVVDVKVARRSSSAAAAARRTEPFCDGTHSKIGFQGAIAAVAAADD